MSWKGPLFHRRRRCRLHKETDMGKYKGGDTGGKGQLKHCDGAPDFARATGMPHDLQLKRPVERPDGVKQLAYPGSQGGRSEKNPKS